jgi:putative FmdB family regulatory protein
MPIYEYRCPNGHTFELFQRFADEPIQVCEVCGASPVVKVLYPAAVHFKGSGFYSTDYGKGGRKRKESTEGGSSSGSDSSSSSDSKSTEKSESTKSTDSSTSSSSSSSSSDS